jgi:1-acyl-sn-glycerol-3-phosphate acyltransferase
MPSAVAAAAYIDLSRTVRALHGIAEQTTHALAGSPLRNVPRSMQNERFMLTSVMDAARQTPGMFTGAADVAEGVRALSRSMEHIDAARAAYDAGVAVGRRGARDVSGATRHMRAAAHEVDRAHSLLGGTRAVPEFEGIGMGAVHRAELDIASASHPRVLQPGHERIQRRIHAAVDAGIARLIGYEGVGVDAIPTSGRVLIAPSHGSHLDPLFNAVEIRRPVRFMANAKLADHPTFGPLLTAAGAFSVQAGSADEGMRIARGVLDTDQALIMYPEKMHVKGDFIGAHRNGVAQLALEMQAPVVPAASYGTRARRFRNEGAGRLLVQMHAGTPIDVRGVPHTPFNEVILRERIARAQEDLFMQAKERYSVRRAASDARRPFWIAGGVASAQSANPSFRADDGD